MERRAPTGFCGVAETHRQLSFDRAGDRSRRMGRAGRAAGRGCRYRARTRWTLTAGKSDDEKQSDETEQANPQHENLLSSPFERAGTSGVCRAITFVAGFLIQQPLSRTKPAIITGVERNAGLCKSRASRPPALLPLRASASSNPEPT